MSLSHVVVVAAITAVVGLLVLGASRPGRRQAARVLTHWGVRDPDDAEVTEALGHLRRRRLVYLATFVTVSGLHATIPVPASLGATRDGPGSTGGHLPQMLLAALLLGLLLAEALEWRRPSRTDPATPVPARSRVARLSSPWSGSAFAVLFGAAVVVAAASLAGAGWARRLQPDPAAPLVATLLTGAVGGGIVWLAARRPAVGGPRTDQALRWRIARIGLGVSMATLGTLVSASAGPVGDGAALLGVVCWIATVNPPKAPRTAPVAH